MWSLADQGLASVRKEGVQYPIVPLGRRRSAFVVCLVRIGGTTGILRKRRDCQTGDGQWSRSKSFDTFGPLGPWIETELDPSNLRIRGRLNGRTMQESNTAQMIFSVPYVISYLSRGMTLLPGTVLLTGTPAGVGFARKPPVWLKPGDSYEVEIEGIGTLRNPVAAE